MNYAIDSLMRRAEDADRDRETHAEELASLTAQRDEAVAEVRRLTAALATVTAERDEAREALRKLRWCIVVNAGRRSTRGLPRWAVVRNTAGVGSTTATKMCVEAGFDPDEVCR